MHWLKNALPATRPHPDHPWLLRYTGRKTRRSAAGYHSELGTRWILRVVKHRAAMQNFRMRRDVDGRYTRTPQQGLARAELLHRSFPNSRTELAALTAARELAAHERRAGLIAQLHKQAIAAADVSAWQRTLKARINKDTRRRKVTVWLFAGAVFIVALAPVVALLWS
jgi:hypothetical protein